MKRLRWRRIAVLAWCVVVFGFAMLRADAAWPGVLDRSFGDRGRAATAADLGSSWRRAPIHLATAPAGATVVASGRQLFRYLPNGRLDLRFGARGRITVDAIDGFYFRFVDLAVDHAGRIVAFGTAEDFGAATRIPSYSPGGIVNPTTVVVLRFDERGILDPSFGGGRGYIRSDLGLPHTLEGEDHSRPPLVRAIAGSVDSHGRPVLVAAAHEFSTRSVRSGFRWANRIVARMTEAGDLDASFGSGGVSVLSSTANFGIEISPRDQSPLVWGGYPSLAQVTRLGPTGMPEAYYGTAGTQTVRGGSSDALIDHTGRMAILENPGMRVARVLFLKTNGSIERRFGRAGRATVRLPGKRTMISSVAIDKRGRLLLIGTTIRRRSATIGFEEPHELFVVGRLRASGRLDQKFGRKGWLRTGFGRHSKVASAHSSFTGQRLGNSGPRAVLDLRGRLVVADSGHSPQLKPGGVILARYLLNR